MLVAFKTFGCKVNQCETNDMITLLQKADCQIAVTPDNVDSIVVNSCTVTANADRKTKQYIRKCLQLNPKAKIFLTGCLVERDEKNLTSEFPNIKLFKNSEKQNLVNILKFSTPFPSPFSLLPSPFFQRTRAFIKIQDGCDSNCSYCVVPKVRPKLLSKSVNAVISESRNYVSAGYKEIVLCGIRLGKYRWKVEGGRWKVTDLIKELEKIDGLCRIRLSSIELADITDDLIELMATSTKLCHHLHIPLQSGDDNILRNMNRPYTTTSFFNKINQIRKKISDIGITTDIIIGYPTDTDETLENTYNFVRKCVFSRLHIFKFSERPNTAASLIKEHCNQSLVKKWKERFKLLDTQLRCDFLKKFADKKMEVLIESNGYGYTSNYIYLKEDGRRLPANDLVAGEKGEG